MRSLLTIFKMDMRNLFKNPVLVGYNLIFTTLLVLIMGFLSSGNYSASKDAYQYYLISLVIYTMLNGAMTASNCFMERDIKRPNLRIIHSPAGGFPIYFSKILSSFLFDYGLHLIQLAFLCPLLTVTLGERPIFFILLMAPVEFGAAALGIFFCCIFHCEETTSTLLSTAISLLCVLGGTFFSLDGFGKAASIASGLSPVKWLNNAFFGIACDNSLAYFLPVFLVTSTVSLLLVVGCSLFFRTEDYL